jgi:putative NIF3 family GTP cyclohydrolase 1 type 2
MDINVRQVLRSLELPVGQRHNTVDRLLAGSELTKVKGIVTCFMPSMHVLEKAVRLGANLIIAHEGLFYSHSTEYEMKESSVYRRKRAFIESNELCVYRCHDYPHRCVPDILTNGLVRSLGWEPYVCDIQPHATVLEIPAVGLREIARLAKQCLNISSLRVIGDLDDSCSRIAVLVGYRGGGKQVIPLLEKEKLDLVVYGEGPEWETPEYIRDSHYFGERASLLILGHGESEEPGMAVMAEQLSNQFPHIPVHYVKGRPLFQIV